MSDERCPWCGTAVTPGSLLGNTLENGAAPKMAESVLGAMRLYTTELSGLRMRVAELEEGLRETLHTWRDEASITGPGQDDNYDRISAMLADKASGIDALWRALSAERRLELMALCCRGCGSLDAKCYCERDE